jgi:hypothetical protein
VQHVPGQPYEVELRIASEGRIANISDWYNCNFTRAYFGALLNTGIYRVMQYEMRMTVILNSSLDTPYLGTPYVWGRDGNSSKGWSAKPTMQTGYCNVISSTDRRAELQTFVYDIWDSSGKHLGWYPESIIKASCAYGVIGIPSNIVALKNEFFDDGSGRTPELEIHTQPGLYYEVEVTTDNELFVYFMRRNDSNFFNSWWGSSLEQTAGSVAPPLQDPAMEEVFSYEIPSEFWENARHTGKIYYRLIVSTDPQGSNQFVTTRGPDGWNPPFITVVFKGDLNSDACVDREDLAEILEVIRGVASPTPSYDLNGDGEVNIADARYLVTLFTNLRGAPCD